MADNPVVALQDDGPEAPLQGTLPRWDFSTGPGLRSHQLATLRSMPSGDAPARTASGTLVDPVSPDPYNKFQRRADELHFM